MKRVIFIVIILMFIAPVFAEDNGQEELINKGFDYIKTGKYQKAREAFEATVMISPNPHNS